MATVPGDKLHAQVMSGGQCTHLLHQAERLCHRVAIMAEGRIAALGTPTGLRDELAPGGTLEDVFFRVVGRIDAAPPS